ncbi:hypothetical protein FQN50_009327 [Emmonsiellopsis sp. PD_5]|nr:hypothetical protein FQN50_009327 [Emmonsiellopsis sp. PD_5]
MSPELRTFFNQRVNNRTHHINSVLRGELSAILDIHLHSDNFTCIAETSSGSRCKAKISWEHKHIAGTLLDRGDSFVPEFDVKGLMALFPEISARLRCQRNHQGQAHDNEQNWLARVLLYRAMQVHFRQLRRTQLAALRVVHFQRQLRELSDLFRRNGRLPPGNRATQGSVPDQESGNGNSDDNRGSLNNTNPPTQAELPRPTQPTQQPQQTPSAGHGQGSEYLDDYYKAPTVKRREIEGDCKICYLPLIDSNESEAYNVLKVDWCRESCGTNFHGDCLLTWLETCDTYNVAFSCPNW